MKLLRRRRADLLALALPVASLAMTGCLPGNVDDTAPITATQPIIGGAPATDTHHAAVVSLHYGGSSSIFCSGTLIAPDVVLTAAHCLDVSPGGPNFRTMDPGMLSIYVGSAPKSADEPYASHHVQASETRIHPSYNRRALVDDIALVRLEAPVADVTPIPALPAALGFSPADVGSLSLDFAGFGYSDLAKTEIDVKLHAEGTLGGLGCSITGCPRGYDQYAASQISYAQGDAGPCNGDSGGPAFVDRAGTIYVGGVTSYGDAGCSVYGASTRVDNYEGFVAAFMSPPPAPSCGDGVCNGDETCSTCEGDCGACPPEPVCGDGSCESGESCDLDCGPPTSCELGQLGDACTSGSDCCSGKCRGKRGEMTCR